LAAEKKQQTIDARAGKTATTATVVEEVTDTTKTNDCT
jgi:hypothetical protein